MKKQTGIKSFSERVVEIALSIPTGRVMTYGSIARAAGGGAMASQSITGILGRAYKTGETQIPFHRIVYSDGRVFTDPKYDAKRNKLYKAEGIKLDLNNKIENFRDVLWEIE